MAFLLAMFTACAPTAPPPELFSVEPARGWNGEVTAVVLAGDHLLPSVSLGDVDPVDAGFEVWLEAPSGDIRLEGAELLDYDHLLAQVPAGIAAGSYPVVVRTPAGTEARLDEGFFVATTRADHLVLRPTAGVAYDLGEYASIELQIVDPNDDVVAMDLDVEISATSADGAEGVEFAADQLVGQTRGESGVGISGRLDADGSTTILVRSTRAADVSFTATALSEQGIDAAAPLVLSWQTGGLANVIVSLPFTPFRARAGTPFQVHLALEDEFGNPLPDTYSRVSISDACGSFRTVVDVIGQVDAEVTLDVACDVDRLTVFNASVEVVSDDFVVLPGEMAGYHVIATPDTLVEAGVQPVLVLVAAVDTFGNRVDDFDGAITLTDQLAGIDGSRTNCPALTGGATLCATYLNRAGLDVFRVVDPELRSASSNSVVVVASVPVTLSLSLGSAEVIAGNEVGASLGVADAWGNAVEIEPGGNDPVTMTDDSGSVECDWTGPIADGRHGFLCRFTTAYEESVVQAELPRLGLLGLAPDPVTIRNAELSVVTFSVPSTVVAGVAFALSAAGFDEYGNPYLRQTDPVVDVSDSSGTLSATSLSLDSNGEVLTTASLTAAGTGARIRASRSGTTVGLSLPITVTAGAMADFAVDAPPWVGVGDDLEVVVVPVDAYGNTVPTYAGAPTASITGGACAAETLAPMSGAATVVALRCDDVFVGATVLVSDGTYSSTSDTVDVVDFECTSPPVATLLVDGGDEAVACLGSSGSTVEADGSASGVGAADLALFSFVETDGARARDSAAVAEFTWTSPGPRLVEMLVVDEDGCGATASAWSWVGEDDGEVTGPVDLVASDSSVASGGSVTVDVAAYDCTGDVAGGQDILLRASLGDVGGASSGAGLILALDAGGEGTVTWTFPDGYAAPATLAAGSASSGGYGAVLVAVTQDSARPHVIEVTPSGTTSATIDEVVIEFDEPLLASMVSAVTVTGPSGAESVTASLDGNILTLTLAHALDASSGTFTVTVPDSVRDEAGNRVDGTWSGAAGAFTSSFGAVTSTLPATAGCAVSTEVFRPDGDDGAGEESDAVELSPVTAGSPTWWWLIVTDAADAHVRSTRVVGSTSSISWDGKGDDGLIVPGGEYLVGIIAIDNNDNQDDVCLESISVAHRLELP
ncbi:MAG: hypothetical protein EXR71_15435 [Myxococcales bacterium]|nr:hypothetical protein [Myxococcales bacterium]